MLLCAVTTWAFTPGDNITTLESLKDGDYVFFKNVGRNKYIYEAADKKMLHGANAESLAYLWQVHKDGDCYSFSSITGYYISTPLDGKDVFTVAEDNASKDKFTITASISIINFLCIIIISIKECYYIGILFDRS